MNDEILNALRVIYKNGKGDSSIIIKLLDEIERLRGSLKFYANEDSWSTVENIEKIYFCDQGERARQALEGETK